jgi:N5-(carboxyethyl)ornithine synthase
MKIGFIIPNYPFEKRVAILPQQVKESPNEIILEHGFGATMDIADHEYILAGAKLASRSEIFAQCEIIFSLKLIQPTDYDNIRNGQIIVGWVHPTGSGKDFMRTQVEPKELVVIDLDNIYPSLYYKGKTYRIPFIQPNFIRRNSVAAGRAAVLHALMHYGCLPNSNSRVAILSAGNVAQGAFETMAKFNADIRMFYRKTMHEFYNTIDEYDIIVNGIEIDNCNDHILTLNHLKQIKSGCLVIDAAADAGNAIEGTHFASFGDPMYKLEKAYVYCVNNAPTLLYRDASKEISKSFAEIFYNKDIQSFLDLIK